MKLTKKTIYIGLFAILYLIVAFSSFFHACAFFGLANNTWMSIILAFAFEVGQAAVLFSLLTSSKDRNRIMPWVLMIMFTLVQVIGNVYSSYKYIKMYYSEKLPKKRGAELIEKFEKLLEKLLISLKKIL